MAYQQEDKKNKANAKAAVAGASYYITRTPKSYIQKLDKKGNPIGPKREYKTSPISEEEFNDMPKPNTKKTLVPKSLYPKGR